MSNLHTEEQAREARCCGPNGCGEVGPDNLRWCLASECMAWSWVRTHINNPDCPDGDLIPSTKTYGRCGLTSQGGKHG